MSTIVVDDEPLARQRLVRLLRKDTALEVSGVYESAAEATNALREHPPQLMLLDIRMPGIDGIQLLQSLGTMKMRPYAIFVTAYAERSLDALGAGAIDYLLKPFDEDRFARAIDRAKVLIAADRQKRLEANEPPEIGGAGRLMLGMRGKMTFLSLDEIEFIEAAGKQVKVHAGGRCLVYRQSLGELERRLAAAPFVRIHRSTVVNVHQIVEMHPLFHGDYELRLKRGARLTLSRRYRDRLKPFFRGWGIWQ